MARLVVDASVAAKWVLPGESGMENAVGLKNDQASGRVELHAPSLITAEVGNALWKATRLQRLSLSEAERALKALERIRIALHETTWSKTADVLKLASRLNLTVYDSCYIRLAEELGARFITADRELLDKAGRHVKTQHLTEYRST